MADDPLALPAFLRRALNPEAASRPAPDPETVAARKALAITRECTRLLLKHGNRRKAPFQAGRPAAQR